MRYEDGVAGTVISVYTQCPEGNAKYIVKVEVPDSLLVELTQEQFKEFCDWPKQVELLGFTEWTRVTRVTDYPRCDKVFIIQTNEVVKPSLFGHALPYTAEVL